MKQETIGFRVTWELDKIKQSQIVETLEQAKKEQNKWLEMGCKVTISPAKRSSLFTNKYN